MLRIFYSWASDGPLARNRVIIRNALKAAVGELCSPTRHDVPEGDRQLVECDGSHTGDIVEFITTNLPSCHAHVVDVTFVTPPELPDGYRRCPNPNNMFELGYAMNCLGKERCVLVFNEDHGRIADLPFDINKLNVIGFKGGDKDDRNEGLTRRLTIALDGAVSDYGQMASGLAAGFRRCLDQLLPFYQAFLLGQARDERLAAVSDQLLRQQSDPHRLAELFRLSMELFRGDSLAAASPFPVQFHPGEHQKWGLVFGVYLQRLSQDCQRLLHRFRRLGTSRLYRRVESVGEEAGHLERLCRRVASDVPDLLFDDLMAEEMTAFLGEFVEARRELAALAAPSDRVHG